MVNEILFLFPPPQVFLVTFPFFSPLTIWCGQREMNFFSGLFAATHVFLRVMEFAILETGWAAAGEKEWLELMGGQLNADDWERGKRSFWTASWVALHTDGDCSLLSVVARYRKKCQKEANGKNAKGWEHYAYIQKWLKYDILKVHSCQPNLKGPAVAKELQKQPFTSSK